MQTELVLRTERWPTAAPFRITGRIWTEVELIVVELRHGNFCDQGEACGVYYRGETAGLMSEQIMHVAGDIRDGCDQAALLGLLAAGGARNAVDCALWELRAQREGRPVWALAGLPEPAPLLTTFTLGAEAPAVMVERGVAFDKAKAIKLKLVGDGLDAARVQAVRKARPDVWLAIDANQGFTRASLAALMHHLLAADVRLIEQPFPAAHDSDLDGLAAPIPVAADESFQNLSDLDALRRRVDFVNIKLDKCGGLTRGLMLAAAARSMNLKVMVGNVLGTSVSMAPAFMLGQVCELADLDGPLMLAADHSPGVTYEDGRISCPSSVWGWPPQTDRI